MYTRRRRSLFIVLALVASLLTAESAGAEAGDGWPIGSGCSSAITPQSAYLGYGPGEAYFMGRVQLRFSDPCGLMWSRTCRNNALTGVSVNWHRARRAGTSYWSTYSNSTIQSSDSTSPACESSSYNRSWWTFGVFADCLEATAGKHGCNTYARGGLEGYIGSTYWTAMEETYAY